MTAIVTDMSEKIPIASQAVRQPERSAGADDSHTHIAEVGALVKTVMRGIYGKMFGLATADKRWPAPFRDRSFNLRNNL
jgi:hypothetical protein